MAYARLGERLAALLSESGSETTPARAEFAADFVRLLTQTVVPTGEAFLLRVEAIRAAGLARTGLSRAELDLVLHLVQSPEFRGAVSAGEMSAFVARFGPGAGAMLAAEQAQDLDLAGYAARHGTGEALLLLDAMFAVCGSDGAVHPPELRRLEAAAAELGIDAVLFAALHRKHDPRHASGELDFPLAGERLRIGRSPGADIVLPDPQVAAHHADLVRSGESWRVVDAGSGRPTVLNGRVITAAPCEEKDEIRIGTYALRVLPSEGRVRAWGERSFATLSVRGLSRRIGGVSLLDDVSFTVFSGEVIAMVGPSGAGKTTLLNAIAGVTPADSGQVLLDGEDFHRILLRDRSRVGVVPQDDIVHPELSVAESLGFSGRLRFPSDTSSTEVTAEVDRVLAELGIEHIRDSRIGDAARRGISGGQRKRVNLGQELLTRSTRVLFLDEPTSGLDPRAAQDIVRLVRQLADRGRIVFLVTHDLSPQVMAQVDHLLVLARGGRLAYFGPPAAACRYFGVSTPDAVFNRFQDRADAEWGTAYKASPDFRKFVRTREELFQIQEAGPPEAGVAARRPSMLHQLGILVRRYWVVKSRDRTAVWVLGIQPPFLALVMALVFPKPTPSMLFMLTLCCLWFGMSAAVRELISDRVLWNRERRVGVGVVPYVGSKVLVLGWIAVLQCSFLAGVCWAWFGLMNQGFPVGPLMATASLTGLCGMSLGLAISAVLSSSEAAVGALPLLLIPQITFSGLLIRLTMMFDAAQAITFWNPLRYAFEGILKVGTRAMIVDEKGPRNWDYGFIFEPATHGGEWARQGVGAPLYLYGFKGASIDAIWLTPREIVFRLTAFTLFFLFVAFARVWHRRPD